MNWEPPPAFNDAEQKTYLRAMSHFGRFRVSGKEACTLLHHITTNNIKKLQVGQGCDAILITNKARTLDWLNVWRAKEDEYLVLTSPNRRDMFESHARQFVLFRQVVEIEEISEIGALWGVFGKNAVDVLAACGIDSASLELNAVKSVEVDGATFQLSRTRRLPGGGVLIGSSERDALKQWVENCQQKTDAASCDDSTYNLRRIECGLPVAGLELTEEINPWEANLDFAISLDKGCYNGQEVIARLNTYRKIKQRLMGLRLESPLPSGEHIDLKCESRAAGFVTSVASRPDGSAIGLGYVRGDYQETGQSLEAQSTPPQTVTVAKLPYEMET